MAIHPRNVLGNEGFTKWFADDGNTIAPFDKMLEVIRIVKEEGPKVGYNIKFSKVHIFLENLTLTMKLLEENTSVGLDLNEEIKTIHMHPDNDRENDAKFGCNILGSYVGSPSYIQSCLEAKLKKLYLESEAIKNYPNKQVQHLLLQLCFSQKIKYLQSSTPSEYMTNFLERLS